MLLMAYVNEKATSMEELWFLDSGCSNHMCGKNELFSDFDDTFRETVKLGDNSKMLVTGKGNIRMFMNGFVQIITNVFYVPGLQNSLLSMGQLVEKGLAILIQQETCKIYHFERGLIMKITCLHVMCGLAILIQQETCKIYHFERGFERGLYKCVETCLQIECSNCLLRCSSRSVMSRCVLIYNPRRLASRCSLKSPASKCNSRSPSSRSRCVLNLHQKRMLCFGITDMDILVSQD